MWTCFICRSNQVCSHREPDLVAWHARNVAAIEKANQAQVSAVAPSPAIPPRKSSLSAGLPARRSA